MSTIRELGEKYGGIISEFVVRCDEEGKDCETEKSDSEMFNSLIFSLKEGELITEKQCMYSCSEKLYNEMQERVKKDFSHCIENNLVEAFKLRGKKWPFSSIHLVQACSNKSVGIARIILNSNLDLEPVIEESFLISCSIGCLETTKMLLERKSINQWISLKGAGLSFLNRRIPVAKYFHSLWKNGRNLAAIFWEHMLEVICSSDEKVLRFHDSSKYIDKGIYNSEKGRIKFAKWLLTSEPYISVKQSFCKACCRGFLNVAKWLASIDPKIPSSDISHNAFYSVCNMDRLVVAKWLKKSMPGIKNIDIKIFLILRNKAYIRNNPEMAEWISTNFNV